MVNDVVFAISTIISRTIIIRSSRRRRVNNVPVVDPENEDPDLDCAQDGDALIIQENNGVGTPDDSADGGVITLDFSTPREVKSLRFLDVDRRITVTVTLQDNTEVVLQLPATPGCDPVTFDINLDNVVQIDIKLRSSGALSAITLGCLLQDGCCVETRRS